MGEYDKPGTNFHMTLLYLQAYVDRLRGAAPPTDAFYTRNTTDAELIELVLERMKSYGALVP